MIVQTAVHLQQRSGADMRLQGRWLLLARVAWMAIALLTLSLFVISIPSYFAFLKVLCVGTSACSGHITPAYLHALHAQGLSLNFFATYQIALVVVFAVVYAALGALIFWRRSEDRMALFASLALVTFPAAFNDNVLATLPAVWRLPSQFVVFLGNIALFLFLYLFPTGRFVPRWTRWLWGVVILFWVANGLFSFLRSSLPAGIVFLGFVGSILVAQMYRYRRISTPDQRQQTKWVVFGLSIGLGGFLLINIVSVFFPSLLPRGPLADLILSTALSLLLLLIPLSICVAILRSRLFDIDLIINRTLVYGALSVSIVGLYVLVVGYLGTLFGTSGNLLISLVATGLVAVLFQPLRAFLQRGVNRLLYGQRDEPYAVITRMSQRLETTLAPDATLSAIVDVVAQALKLPYVAILLRQEETFTLAARAGTLVGEPLILPLVYQAETMGQLHLTPRAPGEALASADRRLLDELARQAGLVAHAVQLTANLQRSHEQLEQRVEERTRELSSLLEISRTVASTLQLQPLLGLILDQLKTVVDYTGAVLATVEGEELVTLDFRSQIADGLQHHQRVHFTLLGPLGEMLKAHEPLLIPDAREETLLAQSFREATGLLEETALDTICAVLLVPLTLKEQMNGLLVLTSSEPGAFTAHHAALVQVFANQASSAIANARLYAQVQELAALEERQRLARELHDSVSQALYGIALGLHTARIQLERDPEDLPESLDYLLSLADAALDEMRALIFELRPESLEIEGLVFALSKQAAALQARHGLRTQTKLCEEPELPLSVKQDLYRLAQEALHNTVKHARARQVDVYLSQMSEGVLLEIRDDGVGFDPSGTFPGHLGLHSMRERVSGLGGTLQIESGPGQGTYLRAIVPTLPTSAHHE